jgi:hypothetical protein
MDNPARAPNKILIVAYLVSCERMRKLATQRNVMNNLQNLTKQEISKMLNLLIPEGTEFCHSKSSQRVSSGRLNQQIPMLEAI